MADQQLGETVNEINELAGKLRELNVRIRRGAHNDAGIDAQVNATLEQLSELVDITAIRQGDGTVTVMAGGTAALVIGDHQYDLQLDFTVAEDAAYPGGSPAARILDESGEDFTARITGGKLAGQLDVRDRVLPSLIGDTSQPGDLNRLAKALAERVNGILAEGRTADGLPPAEALFTVDANDTAVARNLTVNEAFAPEMLAAASPGPPYVSNGTALKLASLASSGDPADTVEGSGFIDFYSGVAAATGRRLADARDAATGSADLVAQAKSFREDTQGVSLDEEALLLMEYQRAYQACAQVITTLNEITDTLVNLLR
jgi:flagellar hook-associated protein 1 FlgK